MAWRYVEKVPELAETVHSGHLGFCFSGMISSPWNLNIGNLSVCSWSEKGKLRWVVFQNTPKMAVPWEAPSPLTGDITVLKHINYTQKTSGEGPCEGRSAEYWKLDEPRSPTVNGHLYGLEVRHVPWRRLCPPHTPLPPRGVTLLLQWAKIENQKVSCPGTKRSQRGYCSPLHKYMPSTCPHVVLRKHPNFTLWRQEDTFL